jgi:hypothetical protein
MITATLLASMLLSQGVPEKDVGMMMCIAHKESRMDSKAINHHNRNGTKDYGLFQINDINTEKCNTSPKELLNVQNNVKCGIKVYKTQGLKAWSTYKICKKEKHEQIRNASLWRDEQAIIHSLSRQEVSISEQRDTGGEVLRKEFFTSTFGRFVRRSVFLYQTITEEA